MNKNTNFILESRLLLIFFLIFIHIFAADNERWEDKNGIALKVGEEWVKLNKIRKETEYCKDILDEIETLKKYPKNLIDFNGQEKEILRKKILETQKLINDIKERINKNNMEILNSIDIMREMVVGEPVERMFITIDKEREKRQKEIKAVEPILDTIWSSLNEILSFLLLTSEEDTRKILSNKYAFGDLLGIDSKENRYKKLIEKTWMVKRLLIKKASAEMRKEIEGIEKEQIKSYISNQRFYIAKLKIDYIIDDLSEYIVLNEYYLLNIKILFLEKSYNEVIIFTNKINGESDSIRWLSLVYKFQSLFVLKEYQKILSEVSQLKIENIKGGLKNILIWIILESAKATNRISEFIKFGELIEKNNPYSLYALYSAAQAHLTVGEDSIALSLLLTGSREKPLTEYDRKAEEEIKIAIPLLYYEKWEYEKALKYFYTLINHQNLFSRALFGIAITNFKIEKYEKAEEALRKIINLEPQNIIGAESLMMLALRYVQKAKLAWNKYCYVNREKERLAEALKKIDSMSFAPHRNMVDSQKIVKAREEILKTIKLLEEEKIIDPLKIGNYYKKARQIYDFLSIHYQTGSFQEVNFTESRERLLQIIDSLKKEFSPMKYEVLSEIDSVTKIKIKEMVNKAKLCEVVSLIDQYRWEREYVEWGKNILNKQNITKDSVTGTRNKFVYKNKKIDSLLKIEDSLTIKYLRLLEEKIKYLFTLPLDSTELCYLKYQLGELYYSYENIEYSKKYEEYDKFSKQGGLDSLKNRNRDSLISILPKLDHSRSMSLLKEAISIAPATVFAGAAHYSLAWCYNDMELLDSAYYHMKFITEAFPYHPYSPQAWMFCGEYHFEKGNLNDALFAYQKVLNYPESEWFDDALYKIAWTQYRLSNPDKAISSFLTLVDLGNRKRGQSLLEKESIDYIAISFSEIDITGEKGLSKAVAFAKKFGDVKRSCQILHRLAQIYRTQGRYAMSKKTYQLLLSQYPKYEKNYLVEAELIALSDRQKDIESSSDARASYFKKYNRNSEWSLHQDDTTRRAADSVAQKMLYEAAIGYHQFALQKDRKDIYSKAIESYSNYIKTYEKTPLTNECHYNLAEIHFSLGNYKEAAIEYMAVSRNYPDSKYRETAAWNAIVAAQMLYKKEVSTDKKVNNLR
ncbi:MAG: tetratricopeptide repeat protein [Chitinispirillaceae bacterium]|nr:tetratricopeptide repeat protein [Chitinispirillaceae bacterium]